MNTQPEALRLAGLLETDGWPDAAAELRRLHEEIQELRQALAQQEQEPVAWLNNNEGVDAYALSWRKKEAHDIPLYTAPPKRNWIGLTDEEVETFKQSCHLGGVGYDTFIKRFAIGIEAKLKEKNT